MPVDVLTQHNNNGRTGANLEETVLNVSNVNINQFGMIVSHPVNGHIYAQPLYVSSVRVGAGVRNLVVVATMTNWIYAFDADDETGAASAQLWGHHLQNLPPVPAIVFGKTYADILGSNATIGILATPAIEVRRAGTGGPASGTIYLTLFTYAESVAAKDPERAFRQLLFALDLATGQSVNLPGGRPNPVEFGGTVVGEGYHQVPNDSGRRSRQIDTRFVIDGTINEQAVAITDGLASSPHQIKFNAMQQLQRPGLLLDRGLLYTAFGSHGDYDPYHGWVFAHDAKTLEMKGIFCSTRMGSRAGIWQAGEGLMSDPAGNVYAGTGNGDFSNDGANLGESFLKLKLDANGLQLAGFTRVFPEAPGADEDFGAASPTRLPDGRMVGGGKDGRFYLFDPGKMNNQGSQASVLQRFIASYDAKDDMNKTHHIHGSPIIFESAQRGPLVYVWGENNVLRSFPYDQNQHAFPGQPNNRDQFGMPAGMGTSIASADGNGMPGAMLAVSADADKDPTAIVWAQFPPFGNANQLLVEGELRAYAAAPPDSHGRLITLWSSRWSAERDDYRNFAKFCCPTIANGRVYQATFSGKLCVYGLLKQAGGGYNVGFGGTTGLTFNGSAAVEQGHLRLTQAPHKYQASSVFCTQPVTVDKFKTSFRFLLTDAAADGFTFTIQSEGRYALGGAGGGLGYGPNPNNPNDRGYRVMKSVALKFDLWDNQQQKLASSVGLYIDGEAPSGGATERDAGVDLHSLHSMSARLTYDGSVLALSLKDETTGQIVPHQFPIDIPAVVGKSVYVGFTAATGELTATQRILNWEFSHL